VDHDQLALLLWKAPRLLVAYGASAFVHGEEVNEMSCSNPDCRRGGCSTEPKPQEGPRSK